MCRILLQHADAIDLFCACACVYRLILATCNRFLFPLHQNVIKRVVANRLCQTLNPFLLVFCRCRRHSIHGMFSLNNFSLRIGFARFYYVCTATRIQFKTMRFTSVLNLTHTYIFQRDYASWLFIGGIFKVIQAIVIQYEPSSFP